MEDITINETESRYFGDLFLYCDIDRMGKIQMLKAQELFRSSNLSNDTIRQITSIVGIPDTALYISRVQFYSCLKLIAASQASKKLRHEIITASMDLPLPKFSWTKEISQSSQQSSNLGSMGSSTTPSTTTTTTLSSVLNNLSKDYETNGLTIDGRTAGRGGGDDGADTNNHHHHQHRINDNNNIVGWNTKVYSPNLIELVQKETTIPTDTGNSDLQSTDSEVEPNDSDTLNRTCRRIEAISVGGSGALIGPSPTWSTASDSPTPTNSVAERAWAKGHHNLWRGLICEEQRQLLGTEEESSDRHSSDDDGDTDLETLYQITNEQREYYVKQFRALQPDQNCLLMGSLARVFFEKSRIPIEELRHIWQLCDVTRDGALSLNEFIAAMHLIVLRRNNIPLPPLLPRCLLQTLSQQSSSSSSITTTAAGAGAASTTTGGSLTKISQSAEIKTTTTTTTTTTPPPPPNSTSTVATVTSTNEPPEADLLHLHDDDQLANNVNSAGNSSTTSIQHNNHNNNKKSSISELSPIISSATPTSTTNNISLNNNYHHKNRSLSNTPPPLIQQNASIISQKLQSNNSTTSSSSTTSISADQMQSAPPPILPPPTGISSIRRTSSTSPTTTTTGISNANAVPPASTTTTTTTITKHKDTSTNIMNIKQTTTGTGTTKDWLNQSKEWTKFTESPTSNVSSPGPKPLNFDIQRSAQAIVSDPQILHPVPLRVTPVSGNANNISGGGGGGSGNTSIDVIDDEISSRNHQQQFSRKPDNLVYENNSGLLRDQCDSSSPKQQSHQQQQLHRDSLQTDSLRAIQRPQPKKLPTKNIGAIPPPPQREPSIGSGGSGGFGIDANDGICSSSSNPSGQNNLNNSVQYSNYSNNIDDDVSGGGGGGAGRKDQPQPPLPPPRPHRHARSSSLDLNKLKLSAPVPPEIPPRISPQITQQISLDAANIDLTNSSFADFTQFPMHNSIINELTSAINHLDTNQNLRTSQQSKQMILPSLQSSQRSSAFEVYRKPTPQNVNVSPTPTTLTTTVSTITSAAAAAVTSSSTITHPIEPSIISSTIMNTTASASADQHGNEIQKITNEQHLAINALMLDKKCGLPELLQYLKDQNSILIKQCNELCDELIVVRYKRNELRLRVQQQQDDGSSGGLAISNKINNNNSIGGGSGASGGGSGIRGGQQSLV